MSGEGEGWNEKKVHLYAGMMTRGKEDIFLHVKSLPHYQRRPKEGDVLTYGVEVDEKQRYYAFPAKIKGFAWSLFSLCCFCLSLLLGAYLYLVFQQILPFHLLAIYAAMSLITIWAYSRDKRAAQSGAWRSSEFRLHLLELLGGWPGAFLAQRFFRHKSRKLSYQIVFWLIVAAHGLLWYHVLTNPDIYRPYQQRVTEAINSFISQSREGAQQLLEKKNEQRQERPEAVTTGRRSIVRHDKQARIAEGVVKEIRPEEGVIVSLQSETGTEGILDASTLVEDFAVRFKAGERIQVAIGTIRIEGKQKRIELVLVEK
jgi:uncharacterized membrane protein YsdA (DUF1294 family)/cold shock CspA family protein